MTAPFSSPWYDRPLPFLPATQPEVLSAALIVLGTARRPRARMA